eukprot:360778-Chlamydomonas_euryale.AAC.3
MTRVDLPARQACGPPRCSHGQVWAMRTPLCTQAMSMGLLGSVCWQRGHAAALVVTMWCSQRVLARKPNMTYTGLSGCNNFQTSPAKTTIIADVKIDTYSSKSAHTWAPCRRLRGAQGHPRPSANPVVDDDSVVCNAARVRQHELLDHVVSMCVTRGGRRGGESEGGKGLGERAGRRTADKDDERAGRTAGTGSYILSDKDDKRAGRRTAGEVKMKRERDMQKGYALGFAETTQGIRRGETVLQLGVGGGVKAGCNVRPKAGRGALSEPQEARWMSKAASRPAAMCGQRQGRSCGDAADDGDELGRVTKGRRRGGLEGARGLSGAEQANEKRDDGFDCLASRRLLCCSTSSPSTHKSAAPSFHTRTPTPHTPLHRQVWRALRDIDNDCVSHKAWAHLSGKAFTGEPGAEVQAGKAFTGEPGAEVQAGDAFTGEPGAGVEVKIGGQVHGCVHGGFQAGTSNGASRTTVGEPLSLSDCCKVNGKWFRGLAASRSCRLR